MWFRSGGRPSSYRRRTATHAMSPGRPHSRTAFSAPPFKPLLLLTVVLVLSRVGRGPGSSAGLGGLARARPCGPPLRLPVTAIAIFIAAAAHARSTPAPGRCAHARRSQCFRPAPERRAHARQQRGRRWRRLRGGKRSAPASSPCAPPSRAAPSPRAGPVCGPVLRPPSVCLTGRYRMHNPRIGPVPRPQYPRGLAIPLEFQTLI